MIDRAAIISAIVRKFEEDRFYRRLTVDMARFLGGSEVPGSEMPRDLAEALNEAGICAEPACDYHRGWILRRAGEERTGQLDLIS